MTDIKLKRSYDPASADDGYRILVDRLWPRGLRKADFKYDLWEKRLAPSTGLREWFHADPVGRASEFERRYEAEIKANPAFPAFVAIVDSHPTVTFLYSSKDREVNNAEVLRRAVLTTSRQGNLET